MTTTEPPGVNDTENRTSPAPSALSWLSSLAPYSGHPASIKDVVDYTRAGGWVPGEHPWWVEAPGYAYGALVAIPVTIALYAVSWTLQRPARLMIVTLIAALLWWVT